MGEQVLTDTEPMQRAVALPEVADLMELAAQGVIEATPNSPMALAVRRRTGEIATGAAVSVGHDASIPAPLPMAFLSRIG